MALTLDEQLSAAQREAAELREKLDSAQARLAAAHNERRYGDAERLQEEAAALRQPTLIAEAHVQALQAAADVLTRQQQEDNQARQERERVEQATAAYEQCRQVEAEALEDLGRLNEELAAAYQALRRTMQAAVEAEGRASHARIEAWQNGQTAGQLPPGYPRPPVMRNMLTRFEHDALLAMLWRTPQLP